jgi:hypothetical protein
MVCVEVQSVYCSACVRNSGKLATIVSSRTTKIVARRIEDVELNVGPATVIPYPNITRHSDSELAGNDVGLRNTIDRTSVGILVLGSGRAE